MSLFAQSALGANSVAVAHDQQANHQPRINRRTPNRALEIGEALAQVTQIETSINPTQELICWDVIFNAERVHSRSCPLDNCPIQLFG
jgi:hypothetical protein